MMDLDVIETVVIAMVLAVLAAAGFWFAVEKRAEQHCLSRGWRDVHVAWNLEVFCSRMEDQTMVTRRLEEIER